MEVEIADRDVPSSPHQPENFAFPKHVYIYDSLTFVVYYCARNKISGLECLRLTQVLSEAARSNLRNCTFQNFPGGACPQTP